jgi:choline dehydrogenase-like flavoprotein
MSETIRSAMRLQPGSTLDADVVIVGLGAGGSMALHQLARAGVNVIAVEEGERWETSMANAREELMLPKLFMEAGSRATEDLSIRVLQGRGVGGSTLHNTNLCKRLPHALREYWAHSYGLDSLLEPSLDQDFEYVERLLNIHPVPDERLNENNRLLERALDQLGWAGGRLMHNRNSRCQGSGYCELGCPNDGKENASRSLIPPALAAGARVLSDARAVRILTARGAVSGVELRAIDPITREERHSLTILAKRVILAGSATGSASLALRSELPDPHRLVGTNLHLHPGVFVAGVFDEPVMSWQGVPQAVECTELLEFGPHAERRAWIVTGAAHPGTAGGLLPGFGPAHGRWMKKLSHVGVLISMLHDHYGGRVRAGAGEHIALDYKLPADEWRQLGLGMKGCARLLFAAGAREVLLPTTPPMVLRHAGEVDRLDALELKPFSPPLVAVHPMSTMWMGREPTRSVVDGRGEHHHVRGLYVADGSLFPTSIGGPPQLSIYMFGRRVGREVAQSL